MRWPFRISADRQVEVHLHVELGFQSGRLGDLVQLLARSNVTITDLVPDRSLYHFGMPERWTEVRFTASDPKHKSEVLKVLSLKGFNVREVQSISTFKDTR